MDTIDTIKYLPWDSEFYNLKIGSVFWVPKMQIEYVTQIAKSLDYDLLYIFAQHDTKAVDSKLVDCKVIYSKMLSKGLKDDSIQLIDNNVDRETLYKLALISGKYSRFKLDTNFPNDSYNRMYSTWMEKSINGEMADYVFVHKNHETIDGMITIKIENDIANIGLIAVDYASQGKGIGTKLIQSIENFLYQIKGIKYIQVATQLANHNACHLYKKNNFEVITITNIYHHWLKDIRL